MIEDCVIPIALRAEIQSSELNEHDQLDIDKYKAQLAILTNSHDAIGRSYAFHDVMDAKQLDVNKVIELERMHGLGLHEKVLNFSQFPLLRVLNLSHNDLTDISIVGLSYESCPSLRVLDVSTIS